MSTGTATTSGGLPTAQGSQDVTLGYSGGQANLFGNIPGKNVGIDVTVNLAATINGIARIIDQDVFNDQLILGRLLPGRRVQLPPGLDAVGAELHPGRPSDGLAAHRSGDHEGRQGPHRQGDGAVRRQQPRPRRADRVPHGRVGVRRVQRRAAGSPRRTRSASPTARRSRVVPYATTSGTPAQLGSGLWPVDSDVLPVFQNLEKFDPASPEYKQLRRERPVGSAVQHGRRTRSSRTPASPARSAGCPRRPTRPTPASTTTARRRPSPATSP